MTRFSRGSAANKQPLGAIKRGHSPLLNAEVRRGQHPFTATRLFCEGVTILEDDILDGPEDFQANLSTSVDRVTLDPEMATVNIEDDDGME